METTQHLLEVKHLKKYFPVKTKSLIPKTIGQLCAVDDVSFTLDKGQTMGIVGESGCGKTTLGKTVLQLYRATDGEVIFEGTDLTKLDDHQLHDYRKRIQVIFQDPYSSLNPRMKVKDIIAEPLKIYNVCSGDALEKRVKELMEMVGLSEWHASRYPNEFSGGQRQRVGIARAIALNPALIICDEPVSALDVSIQSQILNLLNDIQKETGVSYLFIAHGLATVKHISDFIGVMYLGKMLEIAPKTELYSRPLHPYTQALMSAIPIPDPTVKVERIKLTGEIPSPVNPGAGCRFAGRCPKCTEECKQMAPELKEVTDGHFVACHHLED